MDEDISGSHWGDAVSANPSSSVLFGGNDNPYGVNVFADDLHHNAFKSDNEDEMEEVDFAKDTADSNDHVSNYEELRVYDELSNTLQGVHVEGAGPTEDEIQEVNAKKSELLSTLTEGVDEHEGANPFREPTPELKPSDGLFMDSSLMKSPLAKVLDNSEQKDMGPPPPMITSPNKKTRVFKSHRPRRIKGKGATEETKSEPIDPLAQPTASQPDEAAQTTTDTIPEVLKTVDQPLYDVTSRSTPVSSKPSSATTDTSAKTPIRKRTPSKDKFEISVGDPIKVGELTTAHIEYTIKTKTKSDLLKGEETVVNRRYRDFLWLYHQLINNHPGYIIPPPPEKQVYGRFDEKFIEGRRMALEKMLVKISEVEELQKDYDFIIFLSSEKFAVESKERENLYFHGSSKSSASVEEDMNKSVDFSASSLSAAGTTSAGGFMSALTGAFSLSSPKYIETDPYFIDTPVYIENLDHQLRSLSKTLELIITQREETIASLTEFQSTIQAFIDLEINQELANIFTNFEDLNIKIRELMERMNMQEMLTLGSTIDEYSRVIGSVRIVFETRFKLCNELVNLQGSISKKQKSLGKFKAKFHGQVDKIDAYEAEIKSLEAQYAKKSEKSQEVSKTIRENLAVFEQDKIDDFRSMVEIYWEGLCETQKELIELWESFYEKCHFNES